MHACILIIGIIQFLVFLLHDSTAVTVRIEMLALSNYSGFFTQISSISIIDCIQHKELSKI